MSSHSRKNLKRGEKAWLNFRTQKRGKKLLQRNFLICNLRWINTHQKEKGQQKDKTFQTSELSSQPNEPNHQNRWEKLSKLSCELSNLHKPKFKAQCKKRKIKISRNIKIVLLQMSFVYMHFADCNQNRFFTTLFFFSSAEKNPLFRTPKRLINPHP